MSETINQRIIKQRKLKNLTQQDTADKLGIKCSTYSQMERKGKISAERVLQLAAIFSITPGELLYGKDPQTREPEKNEESFDFSARNRQPLEAHDRNFIDRVDDEPAFIIKKSEENLIKILRNLPKNSHSEVIEFINQKYKDSKRRPE